jgi:hypothetical protein
MAAKTSRSHNGRVGIAGWLRESPRLAGGQAIAGGEIRHYDDL